MDGALKVIPRKAALSGRLVFASLFQRHPFVRIFVWRRDRRRCGICGSYIGTMDFLWHVHHLSYDHECARPQLKLMFMPVVRKHGAGERDCIATRVTSAEMPPCEECFRETPEFFNACARRVVAAHARCNKSVGFL